MYEVSGLVVTLGEGVAVAGGFVCSDLHSDAAPEPGVGLPPDLDDPWLGDPWADVWWGDEFSGDGDRADSVRGFDDPPGDAPSPADLDCLSRWSASSQWSAASLGAAPGPEFAALLDRVDITALGADELVDAVAAWERKSRGRGLVRRRRWRR